MKCSTQTVQAMV